MAHIPSVVDGLLQQSPTGEADGVSVGSPAWFAWLRSEAGRSFSFQSSAGTYTARREHRRRGGDYWIAYRTAGGRQHKTYLGKPGDLTAQRLVQVAGTLAGRIAAAGEGPGAAARDPVESPRGMGGAVGGIPLLATKLFAPRTRSGLVPRPLLLDSLEAGLDGGRCTLLSAPAGAGKTTLLAAWLDGLDRPVGWLTLDARDQDISTVLRYLVAAAQTIAARCGRRALARLDAPQPSAPEAVMTDLLNDLVELQAPGVLVLDDYHLVRSAGIHAAVAFLVDHLPPSLHLVIASREDPPLPLPRLRARHELTEIRAADLRFTVEEADAFLGDGMGLTLDAEQVTTLVERTEGWVAGLQLAGLALRDRRDPATFIDAFAGGHRLVADYLTAEVLEHQDASTRAFLLATSVLDRLNAPLCDAVLDSAAPPDSQHVLEEFERSNLFLVPLDEDRVWFRYHHLFADTLRARLGREAGPEAVAAMHRRASRWLGEHGLLPEAIDHALAAQAPDEAATWIEALSPSLFATMQIHQTLAAWLTALPDSVVRRRPLLCVARAWLLIHRVELAPAAVWTDAAARAFPIADENAHAARGAVAATRAYLATVAPDIAPESAMEWAERALVDLAPDDTAFRGIAGLSLGQAALALGRLDRAERAFADVARASRSAGVVQGSLTADLQQVSVQRLRGAHRRAVASARGALTWSGEHAVPTTVGRLRTALAELLLEENDLVAALPLATEGLAAPREFGNAPPLVLLASLPLVGLRLAQGDADAAGALLDEIRPLVRDGSYPMVVQMLEAAEARVRLALGDATAAVAWASRVAWKDPPVSTVLADALRWGAGALEAVAVSPARVLMVHGRVTGDVVVLNQAEHHLEAAWRLAAEHGLGWLRLRVLILRALLAGAHEDRAAARRPLGAAVALAAPEGVVRPFLDEGRQMAALLVDLQAAGPRADGTSKSTLDTLLSAFPGQSEERRPTGLVEPLTQRELEVLRLLAAGHSNAEMAAELFVEQSTVKTHLIHVYGKLGVHSRTQALASARSLRLLD